MDVDPVGPPPQFPGDMYGNDYGSDDFPGFGEDLDLDPTVNEGPETEGNLHDDILSGDEDDYVYVPLDFLPLYHFLIICSDMILMIEPGNLEKFQLSLLLLRANLLPMSRSSRHFQKLHLHCQLMPSVVVEQLKMHCGNMSMYTLFRQA